jgi:hypothetical protein
MMDEDYKRIKHLKPPDEESGGYAGESEKKQTIIGKELKEERTKKGTLNLVLHLLLLYLSLSHSLLLYLLLYKHTIKNSVFFYSHCLCDNHKFNYRQSKNGFR